MKECPRCKTSRRADHFRAGVCSSCYQKERYKDPYVRRRLQQQNRGYKQHLSDEKYTAMRQRQDEWAARNPDRVKAAKTKYNRANKRPSKAIAAGKVIHFERDGETLKGTAIDRCFRLPNDGNAHRFGVLLNVSGKLETILTSAIVKVTR